MKAYGNYSALKLHLDFFWGGGGVSVLCVGNFLIFWFFFGGGGRVEEVLDLVYDR